MKRTWSMRHAMLTVTRKELREAVRDRRSLLSALFYALWGPAVMALALMAMARGHGPEPPLALAIEGHSSTPALVGFFAERSVALVSGPRDPSQAIRARELPVALVVDDDYAADFEAVRPARVTLFYDASWAESNRQAARARALLSEYGRRIADTRLVLRGISPSAFTPVKVAERDLSTAAGRSATLLATLPIFVVLAAFIGGMSAATDLTAGERERGSLESLLIHPVSRVAIAGGKWAAASTVCLATVTLTLLTSHVVLRHPRIQAIDAPVGLSPADAAGMWLVLAPLALLATAGQLYVALFAKTYKEAQTQLSLLLFLPMLPGFMFAFGSIETRPWMSAFPMLGQHVMIGGLLRGEAPSTGSVVLLTLITLAAAALAVAATASLLSRESIVRRVG